MPEIRPATYTKAFEGIKVQSPECPWASGADPEIQSMRDPPITSEMWDTITVKLLF